MSMTGILLFAAAAAYILFLLAVFAAVVYLFILIVKALKKYIASKEVREEKKVVAKSLGEALKENRVRCQMTQEFVAETLGPPVRFQVGKRFQRPEHLQPDRAGKTL